ncbi:MAG: class I SAM-dependent methyltransferase [Longimicrobiales bacterium]
MSHSVQAHLGLPLDEYDRAIRRWIPGYDDMLTQAAEAVSAIDPGLVVDLGAGTGALTEQVLDRTSRATVELWDIDSAMLDQATPRIAKHGSRAVPHVRSYFDPFPPCDAFMASLSLHHIADREQKATLYARAFNALRPGGVFVLADAVMPEEPEARHTRFSAWADHMVAQGIPTEQAWTHFDEWAEEDTYLPLEVEVDALARAGFEVTVPWQVVASTVIVATRPPDQT